MLFSSPIKVENLLFYQAVEEYKSLPEDTNKEKLRDVMTEIFDNYIDDAGELEVNIDSELRKSITEEFNQLSNDVSSVPPRQFFNQAQDAIFHLMELDSFPRFLKSNLCKELATELQKNQDHQKVLAENDFI